MRRKFQEVLVSLLCFREECERIALRIRFRIFVMAAAGGNVDLTSEESFQPLLLRRFIKLNETVRVSLVRKPDSRLSKLLRSLHDLLRRRQTLEERVGRVAVQMHEIRGLHEAIIAYFLLSKIVDILIFSFHVCRERTSLSSQRKLDACAGSGSGNGDYWCRYTTKNLRALFCEESTVSKTSYSLSCNSLCCYRTSHIHPSFNERDTRNSRIHSTHRNPCSCGIHRYPYEK